MNRAVLNSNVSSVSFAQEQKPIPIYLYVLASGLSEVGRPKEQVFLQRFKPHKNPNAVKP